MLDDDQEMCKEMSEILKDEGYCVTTIFDGLEGKKLIEKNSYDLLLLDVKIPGVNGLQILKEVKEKKPKTKVIILTARLNADSFLKGENVFLEDREETLLQLADFFITKPFDVEALLDKIKELIR